MMGKRLYHLQIYGLLFLSQCIISQSYAVMPLENRIIFSRDIEKRNLLIVNSNTVPVLVQAWVDDGNPNTSPVKQPYPFVVLPAIFTLSRNEQKNLDIRKTDMSESLPQDRESLFWINLYEINSYKKEEKRNEKNELRIALNTQMKLIYRPFTDIITLDQRMRKLHFTLLKKKNGPFINITNTTPYYISLASGEVVKEKKTEPILMGVDRTISPFSSMDFYLKTPLLTSLSGPLKLTLVVIGDDGKTKGFEYSL